MATFTNQATLTYRGSVVNSNIVTGEIPETLTLTKDALSVTYEPNGSVIYIVNVVNSGDRAYSALTLSDDLGAYAFGTGTVTPLTFTEGSLSYYIDGVLQPATAISVAPPLTVSGLSLPANSVLTVVYRAEVNEFAPLGADGQIVNTATLTGGGLTAPLSDSATVTVGETPRLDITKAITPVVIGADGQVTYTLTILNYGNTATVATDNVTVTDTFDPILDPISVTYNGVAWTAGADYTYNSTSGEFSSAPGAVTVPAATYVQDPDSGAWSVTPGQAVITVTGTIRG